MDKDESTTDDEPPPRLSEESLNALQEFYAEQMANKQNEVAVSVETCQRAQFKEDWQLSQFWYDNYTADSLAEEILRRVDDTGKIACISCPTLFGSIRIKKGPDVVIKLLEYDKRFSIYRPDFIFYDYKEPLNVLPQLRGAFDIVVADPPFLSEECIRKVAQTIKFLTKDKIILCTGAVMEEIAKEELNVHVCKFIPRHLNRLGNEFKCFANYNLDDTLKSK